MWFYLLTSKDNKWAKFEAKLFSDAKCPGPLLQRLPLIENSVAIVCRLLKIVWQRRIATERFFSPLI